MGRVWCPRLARLIPLRDRVNEQSAGVPFAGVLPSIALQKSKLDVATSELEQFLSRNPSEKENWLRFLKWEELLAELKKDAPDLLTSCNSKRICVKTFLVWRCAPFVNFREELRAYTNTLRVSSDPTVSLPYLKDRLAKLSASIAEVDLKEDIEARREAAQTSNTFHKPTKLGE